jgi:hypothetical protein
LEGKFKSRAIEGDCRIGKNEREKRRRKGKRSRII